MKRKIYLTISYVLLSVGSSVMLQAMQETPEQALQKSEKEMAKLFPQTKMTEATAQLMRTPGPAARNKFYYYLITEHIHNNDFKEAIDILKRGVGQGFDVNYRDFEHIPALLHIAVARGSIELVKALLKAGANPNIKMLYNMTPLHTATNLTNSPLIIQELVQHGADVNARTQNGNTPLMMMAALGGYSTMIKALLSVPGIDFMARNSSGETAFDIANNKGNPEIIRLLAPHYMTLKGLGIEAVKKYREQEKITQEQIEQQLPQELQEEIGE